MEEKSIDQLLAAVGPLSELVNTKGGIGVQLIYPVVYSGSAGGGAGEYAASNNPNVANQHRIKIGRNVVAAFYQPHHNIAALSSFALLDVVPSGNDIILLAGAYLGSNTRIRLKITVLTEA